MVKKLTVAHLYPKEMNIYGDNGNTLAIRRRLEWRNIPVDVITVEVGEKLPSDVDMIISGGGQDKGQLRVEADLHRKRRELHDMADDGVTMLLICGTYQLFGHKFVTHKDEVLEGIGVLDVETHAGPQRLIGNITTQSNVGELIGYENHSGLTYIGSSSKPFAHVLKGAGNNGEDQTEGAMTQNVIGTYLHGPLLPKNPALADELILRAMNRKFGVQELLQLDDVIENAAHSTAVTRPR